ncbi:MAG: NACHT domain-containing protein [Leptolyngbya sp. SIO1E4]|nr:NACHT domain-containing protein [Leptolyngbya sp. SIO1E4]
MKSETQAADAALFALDATIALRLSTVQEQIIRGTWAGLTYGAIAQQIGYDPDYLKYVGSQLWRELSAALGHPVSKSNLRAVIQQIQRQKNADQVSVPKAEISSRRIACDWADAPAVSHVYGRQREVDQLWQWCVEARCRLVVLQGQGGIGKTTLARHFAEQVAQCVEPHSFERVVWRSLRTAPRLTELLKALVMAVDEATISDLTASPPTSLGQWLALLINQLQQQRCLVVLDNGESLLQGQSSPGEYLDGYKDYQHCFEQIVAAPHQSCVVLTSRELPIGFESLRGRNNAVRVYAVPSLETAACQSLLAATGVVCEESESAQLSDRYGGNPLALKLVGTTIHELFEGQVNLFLASGTPLLQGIRQVLVQQFQRLLPLEKQVMDWLAIYREPVTLVELQHSFVHAPDLAELIEALESLWRRSLIEKAVATTANRSPRFTQQPVIMEYVTRCLIDGAVQELMAANQGGETTSTLLSATLNQYSLLIPTTADYLCNAQKRLILQPILAHLLRQCGGQPAVEQRLRAWLQTCQQFLAGYPGYAGGNGVNLLGLLNDTIKHLDCSGLALWRVDLRGQTFQQSNLTQAHFKAAVFTETFGSVLCVAFDPTGQWLAWGDTNGEIRLWHLETGQLQQTLTGHTSWARALAFHPTHPWLISGSNDHTLKVWEIATGECRHTLTGHEHWVRGLAINPSLPEAGPTLASGDANGVVCLWDLATGECLRQFSAHPQAVRSLTFHPDGHQLVTGSEDGTLKLWCVRTERYLRTFVGHEAAVYTVVYQADHLVSGGADGTIRFWDSRTGDSRRVLDGHQDAVWSLSLSVEQEILASSSADGSLRLWSLETGHCIRGLLGHRRWVLSVALRPALTAITSNEPAAAPMHLASGGYDQTVRLWNGTTGRCLQAIQGYTNGILALELAPDGAYLASGSQAGQISFWDIHTGQHQRSLPAHSEEIWALAFSPDGEWLASAGTASTIGIWHIPTGKCRYRLDANTYWVRSLAFSPDGQWLASAGIDRQIRLWEVATGQLARSLAGHRDHVWAVRFSPDGQWLASSSDDTTVKLWDWQQGQCVQTLQGHTSSVEKVVFSPQGDWLASVAGDGILCLWAIPTGQCQQRLTGHTNQIGQLAVSPDGRWLATGSLDQTVRLWAVNSGQCIQVLPHPSRLDTPIAFAPCPDHHLLVTGDAAGQLRLWDAPTGTCLRTWALSRPYEDLNITDAKGLTPAQRSSLRQLGAIDK